MVEDGLARQNQHSTTFSGTNLFIGAVNGVTHVTDFGTFTGSGNTTVVEYAATFSANPSVFCFPSIGSVGVAQKTVVSNQNAGSFSAAAGSNVEQYWIPVGS